jgi:hypothetical protein
MILGYARNEQMGGGQGSKEVVIRIKGKLFSGTERM